MANWKRGLFRVWLALSIPWVGFFMFALVAWDRGEEAWFDIGWGLGPPIAVLALAYVIAWISRGFKGERMN